MIIKGMPIDAYHDSIHMPDVWLSKTSINDFISHGPRWWWLRYMAPSSQRVAKKTPSGAIEGLALDAMLTGDQHEFSRQFVVKPQGLKLNTKEGMAWKEENGGKEILDSADMDILNDVVDSVMRLPLWFEINKSERQVTLRASWDEMGVGLQSRPDFLDLNNGIYYDLKKTTSFASFHHDAVKYGYHRQAAIARWCAERNDIDIKHFYLVVAEWDLGSRAKIAEIPSELIDYGWNEVAQAVDALSRHIFSGCWFDTQQDPEMMQIPHNINAAIQAAAAREDHA